MPNETAGTLPDEAVAFLKAGDRIRAVEATRPGGTSPKPCLRRMANAWAAFHP
jgi:hypothetical protein